MKASVAIPGPPSAIGCVGPEGVPDAYLGMAVRVTIKVMVIQQRRVWQATLL